jgi:hypothetical protein
MNENTILNTSAKENEIFKYINAIRNSAKKTYAEYYLSYKLTGSNEPERMGLSYMAAQSVRMNIDNMLSS